ncbi:MAG: vgr related protein [Sphingopyxis sp.]|nr:vgr related protein [Sphingopyxis sp.]
MAGGGDRDGRRLTGGEIALARSVFGDAIDYDAVRVRHRKWIFFQPRRIVMAPMGHLHFHPKGEVYCDDFSVAVGVREEELKAKGLFLHEMTHVWQAQQRGRWYLVLMRHPFATYDYSLKPGWPLHRYGLEQQAEIVRHYWLLTQGATIGGAPDVAAYRAILPPEWRLAA